MSGDLSERGKSFFLIVLPRTVYPASPPLRFWCQSSLQSIWLSRLKNVIFLFRLCANTYFGYFTQPLRLSI